MSEDKQKNTNDDGFQRCRGYTPWQMSSGSYEDEANYMNILILCGAIGVTYFIRSAEWASFKDFVKYYNKEGWRRFYQDFQREKTDFGGQKANTSHNNRSKTPPKGTTYLRSPHYTVLGLSSMHDLLRFPHGRSSLWNRTRTLAYTDDEINRAFRVKAKEVHPDQNPDDTKAAEKFKKLMRSYEAIMSDRKSKK